jgi:hypothetical protein
MKNAVKKIMAAADVRIVIVCTGRVVISLSKVLNFDNFIVFDGGMGTMLQQHGLKAGELP